MKMTIINGKIIGNLVKVSTPLYKDVSIQNTQTWYCELKEDVVFIEGSNRHFTINVREDTLEELHGDIARAMYTEAPSIKNIILEGVIGCVTGCRVNGGGANRAFITTHKSTYIVGAGEILTLVDKVTVSEDDHTYQNPAGSIVSVWDRTPLTMEDDVAFCKKLDSAEACDGTTSYKGMTVYGCKMKQVYIRVL